MKKLPKEFTLTSFRYKQLERTKESAIYEQWLMEKYVGTRSKNDPPKGDALIGYEVIIIRERDPMTIQNIEYPHMETYPTNSEWGSYGWTYKDYGEAMKKYASLD